MQRQQIEMDQAYEANRKYFQVLLNGSNFLVEINGILAKHGFYTTRYVVAGNPKLAEIMAAGLIWDGQDLKNNIKNSPSDLPSVLADEVCEVDNFDEAANLEQDFAWYKEEETPQQAESEASYAEELADPSIPMDNLDEAAPLLCKLRVDNGFRIIKQLDLGVFSRDSSGRLCYELKHCSSDGYTSLKKKIAQRFRLWPLSLTLGGSEEVFQTYIKGFKRIGIEWDIWSGFIVVAKNRAAENLVRQIGDFVEKTNV